MFHSGAGSQPRHSKSEGRTVWNLLQRIESQFLEGDPELRSYVAFQDDGLFSWRCK